MVQEKMQSHFSSNGIFRIIFLTILLIMGCLVIWTAIDVFLLAFAALLFAILLTTIGSFIKKITKLPYPIALTLGMIAIAGILFLIFWLYSPLINDQFQRLVEQLPTALEALKNILTSHFNFSFLSEFEFTKELVTNFSILSQITKIFSFTVGTIVAFFIFIFVGFYISFNPLIYLYGFLQAFPPSKRRRVEEILLRIGNALRWWLLGKIVSMVIIGILTFFGLWILDVSLAFILGLLAGTLTFIPYIGAILSAIPAILIALTQSPLTALYVILLYILIHIIEGYFITPFIEQRTVSLPPAFTILMQILLTILFGALGLALASPLTVVLVSLIGQLYIKRKKNPESITELNK